MLQASRIAALSIAAVLVMASAEAAPPPARNVVLVPGTDAAPWAAVIPLLEAAGLHVTAVASPSNAEAARRALELQDGPTVLVGHDLGGVVLGEAGGDPKASALVFVAAPDPKHAVAGQEKPRFYAVSQKHETLAPERQRFYAARMKAKTIVLDDVPSHPREIAGLILEAAGMKPPPCGAEGDDGKAACAAPALPRSVAEGCKCTKGSLEDLAAP